MLMQQKMRGPGIEPGSTAWKATMLTFTPATQVYITYHTYHPPKKVSRYRDSNPQSLPPEGSALSIRPQGHAGKHKKRKKISALSRGLRQWCIGNIEASQALAPGSTPGWRILFHFCVTRSWVGSVGRALVS